MENLISVIVPVYNAEKYLGKCIESIINQTYKDIEIILVNDGSKDDSLSVCNDYAKIDSRIRVVDIDNSGVSCARNTGIFYATGKYIQFVDSDDYINLDMTEKLFNAAQEHDVDLVVCGYNTIVNGECTKNQIISSYLNKALTEKDVNVTDLFNTSFFNSPWNKLYKKALITSEFKEDFKIGEDLLFNLDYLQNIDKFSVLDECLYNYVVNKSSATNVISADKIFKQIELGNVTSKWFKDKFNSIDVDLYWGNFISCSIINMCICYVASKDGYKTIKSNIRKLMDNSDAVRMISAYVPSTREHKILRSLFIKKRWFLMIRYGKARKLLKQIYYKINNERG